MSEVPVVNEVPTEGGGETRKRKRRSGWDVEVPPESVVAKTANVLTNVTQQVTNSQVPGVLSSSNVSNPTPVNPQLLAQQILARAGLATSVAGQAAKMSCRIYVGSLHYELQEPDLIALFSAFGTVTKCDMTRDSSTGRSKGFCFIEFSDPQCAQAAMTMDGFELAGRKIKVGRPTNAGNATALPAVNVNLATLPSFQLPGAVSAVMPLPPASVPSAPSLSVPRPFVLVRNIRTSIPLNEVQDLFGLHGVLKSVKRLTSSQLDPELYYDLLLEYNEGESAALTTERTMNGYMLSRSALVVEAIPLTRAVDIMAQKVETTTAQSAKSVLLEDMVTLEDTRDPNLKDEIAEEAGSYGALINIEINVHGTNAVIKLHYSEAIQASRACKALNGRLFAGRKVRASLISG